MTTTQFNRKFISVYTCDLLYVHITVLIQISDCKHHTMKNLLLLLRELWVDTQAFSILVIIFHLICNHYHDDDNLV